MKEDVAKYAQRLFNQTADLLGTEEFIIAGGVLRVYVEDFKLVDLAETDTPIYSKDIDCFFCNPNYFEKAKKNLLDKGYLIDKQRSNSLVMTKSGQPDIDLVFLDYAYTPKSVINDFDFTNCCIAVDKNGLVTSDTFWEDVEDKRLRINHSKIPYHSIARAGKFMRKGYKLSDEVKIQLFDNAANSPWGPYEEDEYEENNHMDVTSGFTLTADDIPF